MRRCDFSPQAHRDLRDIHAHVAQDRPAAGARLITKLEKACLSLAGMPGKGRSRPDLGAALKSFPVSSHLIFYRETPDGIEILRVLHGARDIDPSFFA